MSKLHSAPLLEVIFEIKWAVISKSDIVDFQYLHGDLYSKLKSKYSHRESLIPPEIPIDVVSNHNKNDRHNKMKISKINYIEIILLFLMFFSAKSFSQVFVDSPELFYKEVQSDSIIKLYTIEYNILDSNIITITKFYPSGKINSKWSYTSLSDSIIDKYEMWYENENYKRIFILNPILNHKKVKKILSKSDNPYCFKHLTKYYNGELKTYWDNGQLKRHDVFTNGKQITSVTWDHDGSEVEYYDYFIPPEYPDGLQKLFKFIANTLKYPELAKQYNVQGRVLVSFVVEKDGSVSNIKIAKNAAKILDDEAIRIIKLLPNWKPGMTDGEKIKMTYKLPITFRIT